MYNQPQGQNITPQPNQIQPSSPIIQKNKAFSNDEAEALLLINQKDTKKSYKTSMFLIVVITLGVCIGIVVLYMTGNKPKNSSPTSKSTTLTNNPLTNNGSVDSQAKYCTNPVNANLVC